MKRSLSSLLVSAVLASLVVPTTARALLLRVDFSVLADRNDPVYVGQTASGYFTFDSRLIRPDPYPGGTGESWRDYGFNTPELSFTWAGHEWSTPDADLYAVYSRGGVLTNWGIGGDVRSLFGLSSNVFPDFRIITNNFAYTIPNGVDIYRGTVTSWRVTSPSVPEPGTLLLLAPGILALGLIRKRKAQSGASRLGAPPRPTPSGV